MWNEEPAPDIEAENAEARAVVYYERLFSEFMAGLTEGDDYELETPAFPYERARLARVILEFVLADDDCETVGEMLAIIRDVMSAKDSPELTRRARRILENLAHRYADYQTNYRMERWEFDKPDPDEFNEPDDWGHDDYSSDPR